MSQHQTDSTWHKFCQQPRQYRQNWASQTPYRQSALCDPILDIDFYSHRHLEYSLFLSSGPWLLPSLPVGCTLWLRCWASILCLLGFSTCFLASLLSGPASRLAACAIRGFCHTRLIFIGAFILGRRSMFFGILLSSSINTIWPLPKH